MRADGRSDDGADAQGRERDSQARRAKDAAPVRRATWRRRRGHALAGQPPPMKRLKPPPQRRFESLAVNENARNPFSGSQRVRDRRRSLGLTRLGFGSEALADAFAVTGEAARVDRGLLNDRRGADFLPPDFDPRNFPGGFAGLEGPSPSSRGEADAREAIPTSRGEAVPVRPDAKAAIPDAAGASAVDAATTRTSARVSGFRGLPPTRSAVPR